MNTRKKLMAGLMAAMIIGTIGAVFATAQTDETTPDITTQKTFRNTQDQNATPQEMQSAIQQKLEEFGVFDTQLDNQIAQTEQRLTILNREKELRNQGYNWTEVRNMILNEFDLQNSTNGDLGMMQGKRFGHGPHGGPQDGIAPEESDQ
ncbi:MAG: hypothetical protein NTX92_06175 [Euryarchaeota archaeon]|nr:hypothetical protein [Euryarchaeota archaeon]